ncbi:MAG: PilZ domain-containing protein [Chitinispirillaceae bacterium]|nr:PilZ domain-containing protein [Chitinispirillaceae bacterium]
MGKERRKHPRIETDVTVEVYTSPSYVAQPEVAEICPVVNLSESGMCFMALRPFRRGELLRLTFLLEESIIIIRTDARVIYSQRNRKESHFVDVGVEFTNIGMAERKLIRHYVNRTLTTIQKKVEIISKEN